jgi:hypothetical protein
MNRIAPHKRDLLSLYWAHYWAYDRYLREGPITEEASHDRLSQLDEIWRKMSLGAKKMVDPLWEREAIQGGEWEEVKAIRCPHCGWIHYVTEFSSGPPRCHVCMLDISVMTKDVEIVQKLEALRREKDEILNEAFRTRNAVLANALLSQVNAEMDDLQKLQARMKGAGIE